MTGSETHSLVNPGLSSAGDKLSGPGIELKWLLSSCLTVLMYLVT